MHAICNRIKRLDMNTSLKQTIFVTTVSLVTGLLFVTPYFTDTPINNFTDILTVTAYWGVVFIANTLIIGAISSYRLLFAVCFPIYSLLGAALAYARIAYKATLTPMLIDASLHNDWNTSMELITINTVLFVLLILSLSVGAVILRYRMSNKHALLQLLICLVSFTLFYNSSFRIKRGLQQRFPVILYASYIEYNKTYKISEVRFNPDLRTSTTPVTDSLTVVFVIGESLRANNLSLNGYQRNTTPRLSAESNIVSLPNIYSEYTYTNRSIPHIMTRADSITEDYAFNEYSFISSFAVENYATAWLSNQDIADTYAAFVSECDTSVFVHPEKSVFTFYNWYDIDMLPILERRLNEGNPHELIVMHTIGNHWYYNNHYPDSLARFTPITKSRETNSNTPEEIINSYDNAVLATDLFLAECIDKLRNHNAILIYLSDHGEALGENDEWLHANDSEWIKNPACLVWYSDAYRANYPDKIEALKLNKDLRFRTDFLYHSILHCAEIQTNLIDSSQVIFHPQKMPTDTLNTLNYTYMPN